MLFHKFLYLFYTYATMTKNQKIIYYILLVLVSLVFIMGAYPKLVSDPMSVAGFAKAHLPLWFMYFIGVAEVAGAIGLWIRSLSIYAAYGLFIIMIGAAIVTILFDNPVMAIFPVVIGAMLWFIVKLGRKSTSSVVA